MKSRKKILEEEAKEQGLTPTKDLEVDESALSEEEKGGYHFPWIYLFIALGVLALMAVLIVVIFLRGGGSSLSESTKTVVIHSISDITTNVKPDIPVTPLT